MSTTKECIDIVSSIGEEITTLQELQNLFNIPSESMDRPFPICYDGFEPSGRIHLAQGAMKAHNINKLLKAGCHVKLWVADVFAMLNNKFGGDLRKIKKCGEYMIEVWKACGLETDKVEFLWASEEINKNPHRYWSIVMHIATKFTIHRFKKCTKALGRVENDKLIAALKDDISKLEEQSKYKEANELYKQLLQLNSDQYSMPLSYLLYAAMQCADIYFLEADICQLGKDQRKVNMLAREYADVLFVEKPSFIKPRPKPIIISHHMLMGLQQSDDTSEAIKMSKSNPDSAIFMDDSVEDVNRKIKKAFCKPKVIEKNPILEYIKYVVLPIKGEITITKRYNNESLTYTNYEDFENDYILNNVHPGDVKPILAKLINEILEPVRKHFKDNKTANDLQKQIKAFK